MSRLEMDELGWDELDVLLLSGDAYVDHPSFACALLGRLLISHGWRTGILAQPNWQDKRAVTLLGRPKLFCGIAPGAVDSMLANYTAMRQKRKTDAYAPGGKMGFRPNRCSIVYANLCQHAFPGLPVILGGIEASTRRLTHYDFWTDSLRRPLLFDAKASLLVYGMGELAILEIASRLKNNESLLGIWGTAWISRLKDGEPIDVPEDYVHSDAIVLPSHALLMQDKEALLNQALLQEELLQRGNKYAYEQVDSRALMMAPPARRLTTAELDFLYELPFARKQHPSYKAQIAAATMIETSMTSHRGCGGGCSFCSIALHQGRRIASRSKESLVREAKILAKEHGAKRRGRGVAISDVGGPTANMWQASCTHPKKDNASWYCKRVSCCYPAICPFFHVPHAKHIELLRAIKKLEGVKQVRVASGVRADLALQDKSCLEAYIAEFTGGQLKLAPEHCVPHVLELMRKPPLAIFEEFLTVFKLQNKLLHRKQYVVPYLLSAFPGCTDADMQELSSWLSQRNWTPKQTQCFIPTPGTVATAMYYCAKNAQGTAIYVAHSDAERLRQHELLVRPQKKAKNKPK
ncbi:MAG: YgiQ family radical SAM protein [Desulfovibrionaceae bacterium]|nr:YgiQ family radical SAM protein [Desulfovibrionaceae bacterium]